MNVSIVIPAHNEESCIGSTIQGIIDHVHTPYELLVVADHCTDRTEEIVQEMSAKYPQIRLLRNERKGCFSNSVITGLLAAQGDAVVPVMADLCDDPATINRMYNTLQDQNMDVVCASRYMRGGQKSGGPRLQNILSRVVCYTLKILTRVPTWDVANSYKMYRTSFLRSIKFDIPNAGTEYSMALLFRAYFAGARITEIPTSWTGVPMPIGQEFAILRRFKGYWHWYRRIVARRLSKQKESPQELL